MQGGQCQAKSWPLQSSWNLAAAREPEPGNGAGAGVV